MKTVKIGIIALGVVVFMFMIAPVVSAQVTPEMLGDKWFQVNASAKGYYDYVTDTVTGKYSSGLGKIYIYTSYNSGTGYYTLTTCSPNGAGEYSANSSNTIHRNAIYGDSEQKQVWHFPANSPYITFDGGSDFTAYLLPILFMDVKLKDNAFLRAQFKSEGCVGYFNDLESIPAKQGVGSCKLSGKTLDETKVPQAVQDACGPK